jgi:hypothetical protein
MVDWKTGDLDRSLTLKANPALVFPQGLDRRLEALDRSSHETLYAL